MKLENTGLVLEGGGMRGVYTAGVLDYLMEKELYLNYVIGVSAGACNGASYISKQKGRNKKVNIDFIGDSRYISYKNLLTKGTMFGMDFIFKKIPNELIPFDYDSFYESDTKFIVSMTNCITGNAEYVEKNDEDYDFMEVIRASSSLPFVAHPVKIKGFDYMDGGIVDPIPIRKSIKDGNTKNVLVLTRNKGYRKDKFGVKKMASMMYPHYNGMIDKMLERHKVYNDTMELIEMLEDEGDIFVIRPQNKIEVSRVEQDKNKMIKLYDEGYSQMKEEFDRLVEYLKK